MRRAVRMLCTPAVAPGFGLAGLVAVEAEPGPAGSARLAALRAEPDVGVVLVEEGIYDALPDEAVRDLEREPLPMVVPFPAPPWTAPPAPEEYVVELLRRAIGYRVRLR